MPSSTVPIHVAIDNQGVLYKHWSLFIEGEKDADKNLFHAVGSQCHFRFEEQQSDARNSKSISELFAICEIDGSRVQAVRNIAKAVPIRNDDPTWNCQDYVLDLLDELENNNIVPSSEHPGYDRKKRRLAAKQDGLD